MAATVGFPITGWVIKLTLPVEFDSKKNLRDYDHCYYQSHSTSDEIVPYEMGKELFDSVKKPPPSCREFVKVTGLKHDDPLSLKEEVALASYFAKIRLP